MVCWNGSREAARAVAEAMPILEVAKNVIVVMVDDTPSPEEEGWEPGADISRHLNRHGVKVELRHVAEWVHIHSAILDEAGRSGADLLVMGAFSHSRLRQLILGGVTKFVFEQSTLPVLMAH